MDIHRATASYEAWLGRHTTIIAADLRRKHRRMREGPFVFLRGTFYRWLQLWPARCAALDVAPRVLGVGDLHIENFGTWRDSEGRLVWGVNDVDEACDVPYTLDLVRLATSVVLAIRGRHFAVSERRACEAILEGYAASLRHGGRPFVLAENRRWLRRIATTKLRDPAAFWAKLTDCPPAGGRVPRAELRAQLPDPRLRCSIRRRVAGVGSLGRPRFVAIAEWGGALIAREAKALVPSAAAWASRASPSRVRIADLLSRGVRVSDPFFAVRGRWIVRRLAPDCARVELADLPAERGEERLLEAMGWETANLHLGTRGARIVADLARRKPRWLERAAEAMADATTDDWSAWT